MFLRMTAVTGALPRTKPASTGNSVCFSHAHSSTYFTHRTVLTCSKFLVDAGFLCVRAPMLRNIKYHTYTIYTIQLYCSTLKLFLVQFSEWSIEHHLKLQKANTSFSLRFHGNEHSGRDFSYGTIQSST
jgi:hypothetical protein